jgi:integrase
VSITPSDIRDGRLHVRIAKGSRPYSVPLNRMAQEAVAELSALSEDRLAAGPGAGTAAHPERLIGVADGSLWNWIHTAGIDAGLEVNPHKLRHSFATRLAEKQVHPRTIQDLMNHQDMSQLTRYITVADPSKRSAVDLLDEDF